MPWKEYYQKFQILPNIDLKDYNKKILFNHRKSFYNSIGLNINDFKNKTFLELAPGSGYNAYFLLKNGIKKIDLVDFNTEAIKKIKTNLKKFKGRFNIQKKDITKYKTNKKFDYVLIENALFNIEKSNDLLIKLFSFVNKGGFLIITTSDEFSLFSEKLRGLLAHVIITKKLMKKNYLFKSKYLSKFFESHLKTLKSHTRSPLLWVQDNILHYGSFTEKNYFPINKIISTLNKKFKDKFVIWKTSPDFSTYYDWYRFRRNDNVNSKISMDYIENKINFLHIKEKFSNKLNDKKRLYYLISDLNREINKIKENIILSSQFINKIQKKIINISIYLQKIKKKNKISMSLNELVNYLGNLNSGGKKNIKLKNFKYFWGHGTLILSINKE